MEEEKTLQKKEAKKIEDKDRIKEEVKAKDAETTARGVDLPISTKHAIAICRFLKNKGIDEAIAFLGEVAEKKKAVPMKGEIGHRHNLGRGRYPVKASKVFIGLLKNLKANAAVKNIDASKLKIEAKADKASRPAKPGKYRRKFKRTHITLKGVARQ